MGKHQLHKANEGDGIALNRATVTKVAGVAGMAAAAAVMAVSVGAGAAQAQWGHHNNSNTSSGGSTTQNTTASPATTAGTNSTVPTGVNVPTYGNVPGQIRQFGFGTSTVGTPSCPSGGCYVPTNTAIGPNAGSTVTVNGKTTTVPSTPNNTFPVVSSPTGTSILLPTILYGGN